MDENDFNRPNVCTFIPNVIYHIHGEHTILHRGLQPDLVTEQWAISPSHELRLHLFTRTEAFFWCVANDRHIPGELINGKSA